METASQSGYPTHWDDFLNATKSSPTASEDEGRYQHFYRFSARYRFSVLFDSLGVRELSDVTVDGYTSLIRVGLSFAALDALEASIACVQLNPPGKLKHVADGDKLPLESAKVADIIRSGKVPKFRQALVELSHNKGVQQCLDPIDKGSNDIRLVAEGVRNLVFHGLLTPTTIRYRNLKTAELLSLLHTEINRATDEHFTNWFLSSFAVRPHSNGGSLGV